jgi:hypothetical protein
MPISPIDVSAMVGKSAHKRAQLIHKRQARIVDLEIKYLPVYACIL